MSKLTESGIEDLAIKLFERLGYSHIYAPDIAPDGDHPERNRYDEVLLTGRLEKALRRINPGMTDAVLQAALKEIERIILLNYSATTKPSIACLPEASKSAASTKAMSAAISCG